MQPHRDVIIYRKAFFDLFNDFAWFAAASTGAKTPENRFGEARYCQAAILYGGLCVESAANCCLNAIGLNKDAEKDLEQAKTLSKFDMFLIGAGASKTLDRTAPIIKSIAELIETRNSFVHPKVAEHGYVYVGHKLEKPSDIQDPVHRRLDILKNRDEWTAFDAHKVFVAVHDFLIYLFFEVLGLDIVDLSQRDIAAKILNSEMEHFTMKYPNTKPGRHTVHMSNPVMAITDLSQRYDLDYAYLGWYCPDGASGLRLPKRKIGDQIQWKN